MGTTQTHSFVIGDVVWLKSGGPKMTVTSFDEKPVNSNPNAVYCSWFNTESNGNWLCGPVNSAWFDWRSLESTGAPSRVESQAA